MLVALGTLLLSGCGLRAWVDVEIADDSSGLVTLELASDQALRDGVAAFSPDADPVAQLTDGLEERGWAISEAPADAEWEGVVATHEFADLEELTGLLGEAVQGGGSSIEVVETPDGYSLAAELGPPTGDSNQADLFAQAAEVIDLDGRLAVRFPGEVIASNGTVSEDGNAVTWAYDEESIAGFVVEAEARKPSSPIGPLVAGGAAVLGVGAVIGVWAVRRRRALPSES